MENPIVRYRSEFVENPSSSQHDLSATKYRPVFEDKYGLFRHYFHALDCAERGQFDFDDPYIMPNGDGPIEVLEFIQHLRDTWGFDNDFRPPCWFVSPLTPINVLKERYDQSPLFFAMVEGARLAIHEINAEMAHTGKAYQIVDLPHCVITRNRLLLLTITAKEVVAGAVAVKTIEAIVYNGYPKNLEQWRFKPVKDDMMMID